MDRAQKKAWADILRGSPRGWSYNAHLGAASDGCSGDKLLATEARDTRLRARLQQFQGSTEPPQSVRDQAVRIQSRGCRENRAGHVDRRRVSTVLAGSGVQGKPETSYSE